MTMQYILVQFEPVFKDVKTNLEKATKILKKQTYDNSREASTIVLFPEMAFTGYCFKDRDDIISYCVDEDDEDSLIISWAKSSCRRFGIYLQFGFGRRKGDKLYNSLLLMGPTGNIITVYDKTHLYYTDDTWACEGAGFHQIDLRLNDSVDLTIGFAICMDFNNYKFTAPWDAYEMSSYYAERNCRFLLCSMAWLESPDEHTIGKSEQEKVMDRLNYWANRLVPIIKKTKAEPEYKCTVLICNRIGREGDSVFGGTTCALEIKDGKVSLLDFLGTIEEGELKINVNIN